MSKKTTKSLKGKGFNIVGTGGDSTNLAEVNWNHRWVVESLLGIRGDDPETTWAAGTFAYAKRVSIPDHVPSENGAGDLVIFFYDSELVSGRDVLSDLIEISYRGGGDTRIQRTGTGSGWIFRTCSISKIVMPKLDYASAEISQIEVHVRFRDVDYTPDLSKLR